MDDMQHCVANEGYCTPEDVIKVLCLTDSVDGKPAHFSDLTNPSYDTVYEMIQANSYAFDNEVRDSWMTHQVADHIFDRGTEWALNNMAFYSTPVSKGGWATQLVDHICHWEPALGDKLEYRTANNAWVDITDKCGKLFWFDYEAGIFYCTQPGFTKDNAFRITYRYGRTTGVPPDIKMAIAKKTAIWVMQTDWYRTVIGGGAGLNKDSSINAWNKEYDRCVATHLSSAVAISILP